MQETDLAWAAGIVDGEGCIGLHRGEHSKTRVRLSVVNTDPRMLLRMHDMFGGSVRPLTLYKNKLARKPQWIWVLHGGPAVGKTLMLILPYMVCKSAQAEIVIEWSKTVLPAKMGRKLSDEVKLMREGLIKKMIVLRGA